MLLALLLALGAARFVYALTASGQGWTGPAYMDTVLARQAQPPDPADTSWGVGRRWGPLFTLLMGATGAAAPSPEAARLALRLLLVALYLLTIFWLAVTLWAPATGESSRRKALRLFLLPFLGLQSTAAIYSISKVGGEIVLACCVVGHFVFFLRKRYLPAALLICAAVYFKLTAVVFAIPYLVFALLSRAHRRYAGCLLLSALAMAALSLPVGGWAGVLYPIVTIRDVLTDQRLIPIRSVEVFGPPFLIGRLLSSFDVHARYSPEYTRTLVFTFTALLGASTVAAAVVLARRERTWDVGPGARRMALIVFQGALGFAFAAFAVDFSIEHLLMIAVSVYGPLLLVIARPAAVSATTARTAVMVTTFVLGLALVGNLIPLSMLMRLLPMALLDRLAGNPSNAIILYEKFAWYHVPLLGLALLALSFALAARRPGIAPSRRG